MEPLQVAFDVGPLAGSRTGVGHAVDSLAAALRARDDVALHEYLLSWRTARRSDGPIRLPIPALLAHRMWARGDRPRADRWLGQVDVVHGTNYVVPPARIPRVVSIYDCWFLRHPDRASDDVRRAGQVLRRAIAGGALVHTSSQSTTNEVREHFPSADVTTVPLGALPVPEAPPRPPIGGIQGRRYILAIGTIERRKNFPALIRAFGRLDHGDADSGTDVLLVIAGSDGDDRAAVDEAIDEVGAAVAARVVLTGRIDEGGRAWLLRHATVLAYPSLDEGFGFPLLDAMQVGVPVVASNAGSIPEVAGDAALLAQVGDLDALAANLSAALRDDSLRERLVRAGAMRWPTFTWAACAEGMTALYRRAADTVDSAAGPPRPAPPRPALSRRADRSRADHDVGGQYVNSSLLRLGSGAMMAGPLG